MPIIVEGPDCAGKSTWILNTKMPVFKKTVKGQGSVEASTDAIVWSAEKIDRDVVPVIDRWHYTELIYGHILRGRDPNYVELADLENEAFCLGFMVLLIIPPWEVIERRFAASKKEHGLDKTQLRRIWVAYMNFKPRLPTWFTHELISHDQTSDLITMGLQCQAAAIGGWYGYQDLQVSLGTSGSGPAAEGPDIRRGDDVG